MPIQAIRFSCLIFLIVCYMAVATFFRLVVRDRWRCTRLNSKIMGRFCRWGLWLFGAKVDLPVTAPPEAPFLLVSNHLSYLDILVISSVFPTCYVTSVEIRETPVLGQMAKSANSLFVERRNRAGLRDEILELTDALRNGVTVAIFPEATSTNGEEVLRFRKPLYRAAIDGRVPVLPLCLNYRKIGGEAWGPGNRDLVCWYGDMTFADHLWKIMGFKRGFEVEISVLASQSAEGESEISLAEKTHNLVKGCFSPCVR